MKHQLAISLLDEAILDRHAMIRNEQGAAENYDKQNPNPHLERAKRYENGIKSLKHSIAALKRAEAGTEPQMDADKRRCGESAIRNPQSAIPEAHA